MSIPAAPSSRSCAWITNIKREKEKDTLEFFVSREREVRRRLWRAVRCCGFWACALFYANIHQPSSTKTFTQHLNYLFGLTFLFSLCKDHFVVVKRRGKKHISSLSLSVPSIKEDSLYILNLDQLQNCFLLLLLLVSSIQDKKREREREKKTFYKIRVWTRTNTRIQLN